MLLFFVRIRFSEYFSLETSEEVNELNQELFVNVFCFAIGNDDYRLFRIVKDVLKQAHSVNNTCSHLLKVNNPCVMKENVDTQPYRKRQIII